MRSEGRRRKEEKPQLYGKWRKKKYRKRKKKNHNHEEEEPQRGKITNHQENEGDHHEEEEAHRNTKKEGTLQQNRKDTHCSPIYINRMKDILVFLMPKVTP